LSCDGAAISGANLALQLLMVLKMVPQALQPLMVLRLLLVLVVLKIVLGADGDGGLQEIVAAAMPMPMVKELRVLGIDSGPSSAVGLAVALPAV